MYSLATLFGQHEACRQSRRETPAERVFLFGNSVVYGHPLRAERSPASFLERDLGELGIAARAFNLAMHYPYQLKTALLVRESLSYAPDAIVYGTAMEEMMHLAPIDDVTLARFFAVNSQRVLAFAAEEPPGLSEPLAAYAAKLEGASRLRLAGRELQELGRLARILVRKHARSVRALLAPSWTPPELREEPKPARYDCAETEAHAALVYANWKTWNVLAYLEQVQRTSGAPVVVVAWPIAERRIGACYNWRLPAALVEDFLAWLEAETRARGLAYLDLHDLLGPGDFFDDLHTTAEANEKIAERLADAVAAALAARTR